MKVAVLIARILLGLIFVVFGLNGFLQFIPPQPIPPQAGQFAGLLFTTHYYIVVFALQFIGGVLLLVGRYVPLGLVILGPILVNILLFHIHMAPAGIAPGLLATVLWFIIFAAHRESFRGILSANG
jgi:putative oxidoreductase